MKGLWQSGGKNNFVKAKICCKISFYIVFSGINITFG
jgi:hypothetical protein